MTDDWITQETMDKLVEILLAPAIHQPSDNKGHGFSMSFRVTPACAREISVISQSPHTPYKTSSDLLRDCLTIGLSVIRLRGKMPRSDRILIETRNQYDATKRILDEVCQMVSNAVNAQRTGMYNAAQDIAQACYGVISGLNPTIKADVLSALAMSFGEDIVALLESGELRGEVLTKALASEHVVAAAAAGENNGFFD